MVKINKELNDHTVKSTSAPRCALIAPPSDSLTQAPPVQLGYLASVLLENGYDAHIFDFKRLDLNKEQLFVDLIAFKPDLIGISVITIEMPGAKRLVEDIRKHLPYAKIVLGGVHPTVLPDETLAEAGVDVIVRGEGEKIIVNLAHALFSSDQRLDNVRGITYYEGARIKSNPDESLIEDLDSLPYPAWDMIPPVSYSTYAMQLYKRRPVVATILTSRGCPFGCSFCASRVHGKKIRYRSPANVVSEMEMLVRKYSVGEFMFLDDNFTMNKEHALQICEEIIRRDLGIVWKMPQGIRVDTIDEELIRYFKMAGCYEIGLGIESGNQEILNNVKKKLDLSIVQRSIALIKKFDIDVYGFFILGLPGENRETIMETIRFMRIGFDHISVSFCIPYPGSDIYNEYIKKNTRPDWSMFAHQHIFTGISNLSPRDLKQYMKRAILSFYLHPRRAFLLFRKMKSIPLKYTLRLILNYFWQGK